MLFQKSNHQKVKKLSFSTGLIVALALLCGLSTFGLSKVSAVDTNKDCDNNALVYCGFTSASNFISKVRSNNSGNGHNDLQAIYAHFGLEPSDYDRFVSSAQQGVAYANGQVVVNGQVVATNVKSIGRIASYQGPGYFTMNINGTNYYGNTNGNAFGATARSEGLPVTVLFNSQGVMQFAVLDSCANPQFGTTVTPTYSCDALNASPVSGKLNTYSFTTNASAANNATVDHVVYDFGDGSKVTETNPSTAVTHQYTTSGDFTAKVTVYVKLPGNQQVTVTSVKCQKQIQVQIPFYQCVELTGALLDSNKMSVSLTATAKYGGGAQFASADFDFGDGSSQNGVKPTSGSNAVTVTHTYGTPNTYNASATLHFLVNGKDVTAAACPASVTPTKPPTPECKPGVPVGSPACTPCQFDTTLPSNSPQCVPPTLPNTGAGDTIAIFSVVVVAGFLVYRQIIFRKHRLAFLAAEQGTSVLLLQDPLNQGDQPVVAQPVHRHRRSLRRKRPY